MRGRDRVPTVAGSLVAAVHMGLGRGVEEGGMEVVGCIVSRSRAGTTIIRRTTTTGVVGRRRVVVHGRSKEGWREAHRCRWC